MSMQADMQAGSPASIGLDELLAGCRRVVVVAPHPDDETLGVGGLLAMVLRRSLPIAVVLVTDGEASRVSRGAWMRDVLRRARPLESLLALHMLGWARPHVHRLRLPDGAVAAAADALSRRLDRLLRADDHVFTTWRYDGHADHEATARAVARTASGKGCTCTQFPIWGRADVLRGDVRASARIRHLDLDDAALACKRNALRAYRSQLAGDPDTGVPPVVFPAMVSRFLAPFEVLIQ